MFGFLTNWMMFPGVKRVAIPEQHQKFLYLENPESRRVLLYSHGNCTTISQIVDRMRSLRDTLGVSVCCYEYPGYHDGKGSSESQVNEAAQETLEWLLFHKEYDSTQIILMGRSIGSGPTLWLASREPKLQFAGVILQSPFTSILDLGNKILSDSLGCSRFVSALMRPWVVGNRYNNTECISKLDSRIPILIIHGELDNVIPVSMSRVLMEAAHSHEAHCLHIQQWSTHNKFDEAMVMHVIMTFTDSLEENPPTSYDRMEL